MALVVVLVVVVFMVVFMVVVVVVVVVVMVVLVVMVKVVVVLTAVVNVVCHCHCRCCCCCFHFCCCCHLADSAVAVVVCLGPGSNYSGLSRPASLHTHLYPPASRSDLAPPLPPIYSCYLIVTHPSAGLHRHSDRIRCLYDVLCVFIFKYDVIRCLNDACGSD